MADDNITELRNMILLIVDAALIKEATATYWDTPWRKPDAEAVTDAILKVIRTYPLDSTQ